MTINTAMLVGLGFLVATFLALLVAPAYRRRTVRLTTQTLKRSLPLSASEIQADKDRLRADHAIRVHNLETKLESVTLNSSRQKIDVNRRDARISELEGGVTLQRTQIEELENARRVLEQTVTDRLPKVEARLNEARELLTKRDREVETLAKTAQKQARALTEAAQINVQQTSDIERLNSALSTRGARNHDQLGDARFDGEIALRSEIEALRSKARDQSDLITRLQALIANPASGVAPETLAAVSGALVAVNVADIQVAEAEIHTLRTDLTDVELALRAARADADAGRADSGRAESELRELRIANRDLTAETARLTAALAAFEASNSDVRGSKETPIAMKAKVASLQAQVREQTNTIESLRAETSSLNERLARQSAHYMDEMKRLGAGTLPASSEPRQARNEPVRRTLSDRINDPRVVRLTPLAEKKANGDASPSPALSLVEPGGSTLFSLSDAVHAAAPAAEGSSSGSTEVPTAPSAAQSIPTPAPAAVVRRPRLLDRITSIDKPNSG
jgi:chromosome segregation ATPase